MGREFGRSEAKYVFCSLSCLDADLLVSLHSSSLPTHTHTHTHMHHLSLFLLSPSLLSSTAPSLHREAAEEVRAQYYVQTFEYQLDVTNRNAVYATAKAVKATVRLSRLRRPLSSLLGHSF